MAKKDEKKFEELMKDLEQIVGLQTEKPLKRAIMPFGGIRIVEKSCTAYDTKVSDKIEDMKDAFIKGFKEATKAWGKELPELSQKTYDKVMEKFDAWANDENA